MIKEQLPTCIPDRWVMVKLTGPDGSNIEKLFFGGYGGYGGSDWWKINSGNAKVDEFPEHYDVYGVSGSLYRCYKQCYGMSGYMASVFQNLCENLPKEGASIEILEQFTPQNY